MRRFLRLISALLVSVMVIGEAVPAAAATTVSNEAFVDNENGTVQITFKTDKDTTILVLVDVPSENVKADSNEATRYYYKLSEGENIVSIPLTRGAGKYKIRICKRLSNGSATVLKTKEVELADKNSTKVFDVSNMVVNYVTDDKFIAKAKKLTKSCKTESAKVKKIWTYIVENYNYDYELLDVKAKTSYYNPDNNATYDRQLGICYDISALFAAMLRSVGVEARVVTGHTPNIKEYHAWTQIYDSKKKSWYTIDATYDMCLYNGKNLKKLTMVKKESEYSDIVYIY